MFRTTQQQQQRHQIDINSQVQVKTECNNWMSGTPSHIPPNSKLLKFTRVYNIFIFNTIT